MRTTSFRIEHGKKTLKITSSLDLEESVNNLSLPGKPSGRNLIGPLHAPSRVAGELPGGFRCATHDGGNFLEGQGKHIVHDEGEAFGGSKPVENHEQRKPD